MMTFRNLAGAALLGLASLTIAVGPANAAACRGPNGRFIKCATSAALPAKSAAKRTALAIPAKPRSMAQTATPVRIQTAAVRHRAAPKTAAVHAKTGAKPITTVAPKKG